MNHTALLNQKQANDVEMICKTYVLADVAYKNELDWSSQRI
jgi:hypothetical protein